MFGIGTTELLVIIIVALLVIGPEKLPQIMRTVGKGMAEFKRMSSDVKSTLEAEVSRAEDEEKKRVAKRQKEAAAKAETAAKAEAETAAAAAEQPAGDKPADSTPDSGDKA